MRSARFVRKSSLVDEEWFKNIGVTFRAGDQRLVDRRVDVVVNGPIRAVSEGVVSYASVHTTRPPLPIFAATEICA